jgi:polyprenyl-phospho-N-acetylgalactosaminyl synthase
MRNQALYFRDWQSMYYQYVLLFCGMLFGGETVLLPAIYLVLIGKLQLIPLIIAAALATIISDSGWYFAGRFLPVNKLRIGRFPGRKWTRAVARTSELFKRHGLKAIICSKFVYGTRIATQVLAGVTHLPYGRYFITNTAGVLSWLGALLLLGFAARSGVDLLNVRVHRAYLLIGLFLAALLFWRWMGRHIVSRILSISPAGERISKPVPPASVSAIVPAFNEASTIVGVLEVLLQHPTIDDIIVVDDGSTDDTAARVKTTSANLISLQKNSGKATAMAKGVECARHETIFFLDADLRGLTTEIIDALISPVVGGDVDMMVAIRDRRQLLLNNIVYFAPILGGERVLTKTLWNKVPSWCIKSFQIEIALNYFSKRAGATMGFALMPGLTHVKKEAKRTFWPGVRARASMYAELVSISFRLYIIRSIANFLLGSRNPHLERQPALPHSG